MARTQFIPVLGQQGLQVVLCTPTATPPAWLVRAHPEVLPVDRDGRVREFGSRRHYEPASEIYRAESRRIASAMAERGIPHALLPERVRVATRGALATWMNFNETPVTLPDGTLLGPVSFEQRPV